MQLQQQIAALVQEVQQLKVQKEDVNGDNRQAAAEEIDLD